MPYTACETAAEVEAVETPAVPRLSPWLPAIAAVAAGLALLLSSR